MTRATNYRLEIAREEGMKSEELVKGQKVEVMVAKWYRDRREISLSSEEENKSDIGDDIDLDKTDDKYPLPFQQ